MSKFKEVCETKKFLPRLTGMMIGHGLLYSNRDVDKIVYEGLEFQKEIPADEDKFSYAIGVFFNTKENIVESITKLIKNVMSNGYVYAYIPHRHYVPFSSGYSHIPHDILVELKQVEDVMFEIVDFQTFPYEGSYGSKDPEKSEYAFQIIIKKANTLFAKKDLSDDAGQMVSLDD